MTVSFHKYGDFFPGTGNILDVGAEAGKYYTVNFPLNSGTDDHTMEFAFKPVIKEILDRFKPEAI